MQHVAHRMNGRFLFAGMLCAVLLTALWAMLARPFGAMPVFPISSHRGGETSSLAHVEESAASGAADLLRTATHPNWFTTLFSPTEATPRERAIQQIQAAGAAFTGDDFVRAVASRQQSLVGLFLRAGMDVNKANAQGRTALLVAVQADDRTMCEQLFSAGADPNLAGPEGLTALMAAAGRDATGMLRFLLDHGARLESADAHGHTALHYAVCTRSIGAMQTLLEKGAPCTGAKCCDGTETLYDHACETQDWRIVEPILQRQPDHLAWNSYTRRAAVEAAKSRDQEKMRLLLSKHATSPAPEGRAQPLLAYAVMAGDFAEFKFLLDCGEDPNLGINSPTEKVFYEAAQNAEFRDYLASESGMNVLMLAAGMGRTPFVQELVRRGANRGTLSARSKLPAVLFGAMTQSAPAMQALIPGAPAPDKLKIEISLGAQEATVFQYGTAVKTTEISTGKPGYDTKPGEYVITDKNLMHRSTIYKCDMPFFMRLNGKDFGMHEGVCPGYPASHGCIRMPSTAARELFKEIPIGTLVSIHE